MADVVLSPRVKTIFKAEGVSETEGAEMVRRSALYQQGKATRRFHHWWFKVTGTPESRVCEDAGLVDLTTVGAYRGHGYMEEEHDLCLGAGCHECGWNGTVIRYL